MIDTQLIRAIADGIEEGKAVQLQPHYLRAIATEIDGLRERLTEQQNVHAHISTTLQHATEDKAKILAVLQQLHMKRADPHDITQLLEFYLEAHLLIRNLLNGVPMEANNRG